MKIIMSIFIFGGVIFGLTGFFMMIFVNPGYEVDFSDKLINHPLLFLGGLFMSGLALTMGLFVQKIEERLWVK